MPKASSTETKVARPRALELFTDRGEQQDILRAVIAPAGGDSPGSQFITVFYGVGGVGKSALRRRAQEMATTEFPEVTLCTLDLDSSHWTPAVPVVHLFVDLVALLERFGVSMRLTQALLVIYAQSESRVSVRLDDGGLWDKAFSVVDKGLELTGIPYAGTILKGARWLREKQVQLAIRRQLAELGYWPTEQDDKVNLLDLEVKIGKAMFKDVIAWLAHDEARQLRLIIDGFERLQGSDRRMDAQKRLQDVLGYFAASDASDAPKANRFRVIIFGRNRLRWDQLYDDDEWKNYWNQHLLSGLDVEDARLFLESYARWLRDAGQPNTALALESHVESILNAADERIEGKRQIYPFYLDLAVDQLQNCVRKGLTPDFGKTPIELQERFLKYLGEAEERALMILALAEIFEEDLYDWLAKERLIALPAGAFHSALRRDHSYFEKVQKAGPDSWKLHRKMEDVLQDRWLSSDALHAEGSAITNRLIDFYGKRLETKPPKDWGTEEVGCWRRGMEILTSQGPERALLAETDWAQKQAPWNAGFPVPLDDRISFAQHWLIASEKRCGPNYPATLKASNDLGDLLAEKGDYDAAEGLYRSAIQRCEESLGSEHRGTLFSILRLGKLLFYRRRALDRSAPLFSRALTGFKKVLGSEHPYTLGALADEAAWFFARGDYDSAEEMYQEAIEGLEKILGPEDLSTLNCINNLGKVLQAKGDYDGAEALYRRVLAHHKKLLGDEHPATLASFSALGSLFNDKGEYDHAEQFLRLGLEGRMKVLGAEHPDTITNLGEIGRLLWHKGEYEQAERVYRDVLARRETALGKEHPDTIKSITRLAGVLHKRGSHQEAEELLRRALAIREKALGPEHRDTLKSLKDLALFLCARRDYASAEALYRHALETYNKAVSPGYYHRAGFRSLEALGNRLTNKGDYEGAQLLYDCLLETHLNAVGPEHRSTLRILDDQGRLLHKKGDYTGAEALYRRALEGRKKLLGDEYPDTLTSLEHLANLLSDRGDYNGAEMLYRRVLADREKIEARERCGRYGTEKHDTLNIVNCLAGVLRMKGDLPAAVNLLRSTAETSEICMAAVRYNLACYECLSGNLNEAQELIAKEIADDPKTRNSALQDTDLVAIHDYISTRYR